MRILEMHTVYLLFTNRVLQERSARRNLRASSQTVIRILDETAEEERLAICLNQCMRNWVDRQAKILMFVLITVMMVQHFILSMVGICWEVICIHQCLRHLGSGETRIHQRMRSRREIATLECEGSGELRIYQCMRSFGIGAMRASGDISS